MIKDRNIAGKVIREFIPVQGMAGWDATQVASLGAGALIYQEALAAAQLAGAQIGAAGDELYHLWKIPYALDRDYPIQMRILFSTSSADADTPDWLATMKGLALGQALSDSKTTPDATFTFAAKALLAVANALNATNWVKVDAPIFAAGDLFAMVAVECNGLGGAAANELTLWGIEVAYTAKRTTLNNERETTEPALSNTLA